LAGAADALVEVIREVRPQVLVTYDEFGGYGHPDHIQAHRVAMYAAQLASVASYRLDLGEPHDVAKIYWSAIAESRMRESIRQLRESGDTETFAGMEPDGDLGRWVTPDDLISARIDGSAVIDRKMTALAAHRSQVEPDGFFFSGAESGHAFWAEEFFRLAKGTAAPAGDGLEDDLFAGL
ncbi:MAG: PIG-L family deacetylase, partial [Nocardioides sp.]